MQPIFAAVLLVLMAQPNKALHLTAIPLRSCVMKKGESLSCCIKDESRPLGFGGQKLEPNYPMRLLKRAVVVSDPGKGHREWSGTYYGDERK